VTRQDIWYAEMSIVPQVDYFRARPGLGTIAEGDLVQHVSGYKAEDTTLGVSSRPNLIATSYPQSSSEGELRGLFRSTLETIYR
jgi:hypothetical protein